MSFLQSKLEHVTSAGLASEARRRWLVDKAALEREKRECKQEWVRSRRGASPALGSGRVPDSEAIDGAIDWRSD